MHRHLRDLPVTGKSPAEETQATVDELSQLTMPVINHPEVSEAGFSVTHLTMDSDPEIYEVRQIWVRTTQDDGRQPHELGLWVPSHPTLGEVLFGSATTELGRYIDAWWNALRDSRYRDAVLAAFGRGDIQISKTGITVLDEFEPYEEDWR